MNKGASMASTVAGEPHNGVVIRCSQLKKSFSEGDRHVDVLQGIDFTLMRGERVAVIGSSGSGKSTLLHLLGGLDLPTSGDIHINGQSIIHLSAAQRGAIRQGAIGFIYQFHHLLPEFTALENVAMPLLLGRSSIKSIKARARDYLGRVGLAHRAEHKPSALSGGERQRVAIARALVTHPQVVMADEPTGNLDSDNAEQVQALLLELNQEMGTSFLVVTHDMDLAKQTGRVLRMSHGVLTPF